MKKGFTLIELLAVIVILAIILMIATPMVLNVINDAKHSAARSSAEFFVKQVQNQLAISEYMDNQKLTINATSNPVNKLDITTVKMSELPKLKDEENTAIYINDGVISGTIAYQGYVFNITAGVVAKTGTKY